MPSSCFGSRNYVNIGVYLGNSESPTMLSERSRNVFRVVVLWERIHMGSTDRSEGQQIKKMAHQQAASFNDALQKFKSNPVLRFRRRGSTLVAYCGLAQMATIYKSDSGYHAQWFTKSVRCPQFGGIMTYSTQKEARGVIQSLFNEFVSVEVTS